MNNNDLFDDINDYLDWVVEPSPEQFTVINATLNADAGLNEEYD